uniref:Pre-mRNA-splicing factor CWC15 n=1 Tax=Strongyloides stercoralis TaxID=6248 RepID=A0A0K0EQJ9_STRER
MKTKNGVSTIEKIDKYREEKQFPSKDELFWDAKRQEESDDEAPEEMTYQGFTKKSSLKMTKMSSKAKKALKEEEDNKLLSEESKNKDKDINNDLDSSEEDLEDEEDDVLEDVDSETEITQNNIDEKIHKKIIIKPKVPFNFKSSLLSRKRNEDDLYLDMEKQNNYFKKQKFC